MDAHSRKPTRTHRTAAARFGLRECGRSAMAAVGICLSCAEADTAALCNYTAKSCNDDAFPHKGICLLGTSTFYHCSSRVCHPFPHRSAACCTGFGS
mmetsp:Transcript_18548/g.37787  ORF Transcript_18548/g.37787 Transcript_18548/m.37787 type:complete len:97 (-) Transcript_18548:560-850(-)